MAVVASSSITLTDLNDSKQLQLFIDTTQDKTQIFNPNNNSYTPNWTTNKPVLTPQLFIAGGSGANVISQAQSINWYEGNSATPITSNTNYTLATTGVKTLTINTNILSSKNSQRFVCQVVFRDPDTGFDITCKADIEFTKTTNGVKGDKGDAGVNAIVAVLSNEAHTVPTNSAGANGVFGGATSTLTIYEGATDVTGSWTITQTRSAVTVTEATSSRTATVTAMSADSGYVDFVATRSGYSNITKRFTLVKNKQGSTGSTGSTGASATAYWMVVGSGAIQKNASGVFTPSPITFTAKSQTGAGTPANYSGRWIISTTTDGTTYTSVATSTANEASRSYTPSGNIKAVKVQMYLAGGTTTLLDEQIIPVVVDGAKGDAGEDSVVAVVSTPDGNMIRNSNGTLKATVTVYKGSTVVTPTAIKWYIQDPTATATSGGDSDGGAGWRLLNSTYNAGTTGYTSATLTVPASAIAGLESFMSIITYSGKKFRDVCTMIDVFDPITVTIAGAETFKNGQGTNVLTAKLYRNEAEIDTAGTQYNYNWAIYNPNNTLVTAQYSTLTGKTVTIDARDVTGKAFVICEVSPK